MSMATVSTKGQITLPAQARKATGIKAHDRVFVEAGGGVITVRPAPDIFKFKGFLGKVASREEERKAAMEYVAGRQEVRK